MQLAGVLIAALAGLGIAVIGVLYLVRPRATARSFGLPAVPEAAAVGWLRVKGVRDLASGLLTGMLLLIAPTPVLGWALLVFVLVPAGDAALVLQAGGPRSAGLGVHGTTAAVMLLGAVLLLAG